MIKNEDTDATIDHLNECFDRWLSSGEFGKADAALELLDPKIVSDPTLLVCVLSATLRAKHRLANRQKYVSQVRAFLQAADPVRCEGLIRCLE